MWLLVPARRAVVCGALRRSWSKDRKIFWYLRAAQPEMARRAVELGRKGISSVSCASRRM
ncbi:hypothetical protein A2U01_0075888, partial [Trifolium medium]|nr:hypothetical protein [Trifolium medium]